MKCPDCNGRGWVISLNTERDIAEVQRCGTCQTIASDAEAGERAQPVIAEALERLEEIA